MNINELLTNGALQEKITNAESLEEIVKILAAEGIEIAVEQLEAALAKSGAEEMGELTEDALDDVSGGASAAGIVIKTIIEMIKKGKFPKVGGPILPIFRK